MGRAAARERDARARPHRVAHRPYAHADKPTFSDVSVDPSTGTFGLRVLVPNPDNVLLPVYFQVALLTTVGLSSKNAILIVEFA